MTQRGGLMRSGNLDWLSESSTWDLSTAHIQAVQSKIPEFVGLFLGNLGEHLIAEFGVGSGSTSLAFLRALQAYKSISDKIGGIYFFDSFMGLPEINNDIDLNHQMVVSGHWKKGACKGCSADDLRTIIEMTGWSAKAHIYEGYFEDTLPTLSIDGKFGLIHLDCDLYQSASVVLNYLGKEKLINDTCIIMVDDYYLNRFSPSSGCRLAFEEFVQNFSVKVEEICSYGIFSKCFLIRF
jgi:hypothetical protein